MKIFTFEFKKSFTDKATLFFLIGLIIINLAGIYVNELSNFEYGSDFSAVKKIDNDLMAMSDEAAISYLTERISVSTILSVMQVFKNDTDSPIYKINMDSLKKRYPDYDIKNIISNIDPTEYSIYTHQIHAEIKLLNTKLKEAERTFEYSHYVDNIIEKAQQVSDSPLFQTSEFAKRNNKKTLEDYSSLNVGKVEFNSSKAITSSTSSMITLVLSIIMVMFFCIRIFVKDKENNTIELFKTMKYGRASLMVSKLLTLFFLIIVGGLLLNLSSLFVSYLIYGFGDLSAPIQTIVGFTSSIYEVSVFQYLVLYNLFNIMTLVLLGFLFMLIFIILNKSLHGYIGILAFTGVSIALNLAIDPVSSLNLLKYLNIYNFLASSNIINRYLNLSMFGYPMALKDIFYVSTLIAIGITFFACVSIFSKQKISGHSSSKRNRISKREKKAKAGILRYELYKAFIISPTLIIMIIVLALQVLSTKGSETGFANIEAAYYEYYMDKLKGPISESKTKYLLEEKERVTEEKLVSTDPNNTYANQLVVLDLLIKKDMGLNKLYEDKMDSKNSEKLSFIYELGYERFLLNNSDVLLLSLITALLAVLSMTNIFLFEYRENTYNIINVTKHGRQRTFWYKIGIKISMAFLIILITYTPFVYRIKENYGLSCIDAPIASLESFSHMPINISIGGYLVSVFIVKVLGLVLVSFVISFLASKFKSFIMTLVVSTFIVIVPSFLSFIGLKVFESILFNSFLIGNSLISYLGSIYPYALFTLLLSLVAFSFLYIDYNKISFTK